MLHTNLIFGTISNNLMLICVLEKSILSLSSYGSGVFNYDEKRNYFKNWISVEDLGYFQIKVLLDRG